MIVLIDSQIPSCLPGIERIPKVKLGLFAASARYNRGILVTPTAFIWAGIERQHSVGNQVDKMYVTGATMAGERAECMTNALFEGEFYQHPGDGWTTICDFENRHFQIGCVRFTGSNFTRFVTAFRKAFKKIGRKVAVTA